MKQKWKSWKVSKKEAGMSLLSFLKSQKIQVPSVKAIKRAIEAKSCTVNRQLQTFSSCVLNEGDCVSLDMAALEEQLSLNIKSPDKKKMGILFEDASFFIFNKIAGITSDMASLRPFLPSFEKGWSLVHRLDKETTGILIIAKTPFAKEKMLEAFKNREVSKVYLAIVDKEMKKEAGTIDNFLGVIHRYEGQTIYGPVERNQGMRAITQWKCIVKAKGASIVWCEPKTGRTHQLRVHLSGLGHPILGDTQYAKRFSFPHLPKRYLLHAYKIQFTHPKTQKKIQVTAPIPSDFKEIWTLISPHLVDFKNT